MLERLLLARSVGEVRQHAPDLADDLGVIGAERDMRLGMVRLELDRLVEARLHLAADALRQGLGDRDLLRIAPERLGVEIEGVDEIRRRRLQRLGALGRFQENLALPLALGLEIGRIDVGRLVGGVGADRTERRAFGDRGREVAPVIGAPGRLQRRRRLVGVGAALEFRMPGKGLLHEGRVGERLAVAAMQFGPGLFQRRPFVAVPGGVIGKWLPLDRDHGVLLRRRSASPVDRTIRVRAARDRARRAR